MNPLSKGSIHRVASYPLVTSIAATQRLPVPKSSCNNGAIEALDWSPDPFAIFSSYASSRKYTIHKTQVLHSYLLKTGLFGSTVFVANSLLDWYWKSGAVSSAHNFFDEIPVRNVVTWNIMISGSNFSSLYHDSSLFFSKMCASSFLPNDYSYGCVLSACAAIGATKLGKQIYSHALKSGYIANGFVRSATIDMLSKSGKLDDAWKVFSDVECDNIVTWNSLISGAAKNNNPRYALELFQSLCRKSLEPNTFTFSSLLDACSSLQDLETGKSIHAWVIKMAESDVYVDTSILDLYANCNSVEEATKQFSKMPIRNVVSRTIIISSLTKMNDFPSAFSILKEMIRSNEEINSFTLTSIIAGCPDKQVYHLHAWIITSGISSDAMVAAALIHKYSKLGAMRIAESAFATYPTPDAPQVWCAMITSHSNHGEFAKAYDLLVKMLRKGTEPDEFCYTTLLGATCCVASGRQIHSRLIKLRILPQIQVSSSLFTMYSKCGRIDESRRVFEQMRVKDRIAWTSMIAGLAVHRRGLEAFSLFREMASGGIKPDGLCLAAALTACKSSRETKEIHGYAVRSGHAKDSMIGSWLISAYSNCGMMKSSQKAYDALECSDACARSALIRGLARNGMYREALHHLEAMVKSGTVDADTVSSVMSCVACLDVRRVGQEMHAVVVRNGLAPEAGVGSSVMTMYAKSGSMRECDAAFRMIEEPDVVAWTVLMASFAEHGYGEEAVRVYGEMKGRGVRGDAVTFLAVLSACSHASLVEEAWFYMREMGEVRYEHCACMVDVLARGGRAKEAVEFIEGMGLGGDAMMWKVLLGGCGMHGDEEIGRLAIWKVAELGHVEVGDWINMSNLFAARERWDEVLHIRNLISASGFGKIPGWAW